MLVLVPRQMAGYKILKSTHGETRTDLKMRAACAFDAQSYARLKPLADADAYAYGIALPEADFKPKHPGEVKLMTISRQLGW